VTYVTERCVMKLTPQGLVVTEVAPGVDIERDILGQAGIPLAIANNVRQMDAALFHEDRFGLTPRQAA
jgi:acyl CoA:acetate/3-ketoacid CoA transferase